MKNLLLKMTIDDQKLEDELMEINRLTNCDLGPAKRKATFVLCKKIMESKENRSKSEYPIIY